MQQIPLHTTSLIQSIFESERKSWERFQETNKNCNIPIENLKQVYYKYLSRKLILTLDKLSKKFGTTFSIRDTEMPLLQYICNVIIVNLSSTAPESTVSDFCYEIIAAIKSIRKQTVAELTSEPFIYSAAEKQQLFNDLSKLIESAITESREKFDERNIETKKTIRDEYFEKELNKRIQKMVTGLNKEFGSSIKPTSEIFVPTIFIKTLLLKNVIDTNNISLIQTLALNIVDTLDDVSRIIIEK